MLRLINFCFFLSCVILFIAQPGHGFEIIGGKEVKKHSLPFMALLEHDSPRCGGILIDPAWVLTAAHCADIKEVTLGVHSIKEKEERSRQRRAVEKHFPHPSYSKEKRLNDLMLLKLNKPVKQTKTVQWLQLRTHIKDPAAGSKCLVAGWGKTETKDRSDVLMSAKVTVIDRQKCNSNYNHKPVITSDMICAYSDGKKKTDTCNGDSGGPLMCNGVLAGVTSFGWKNCGEKPGVYSFLSQQQLEWINNTIYSREMW